jgi:glycine hydroxymethyltransferase
VKNLFFPFDSERKNIDVEKARVLIEDQKPSVVVFGQSYFLFPHPVKELAEACHTAGSQVVFDASHVLGLIGGGQFQQPLNEGAEMMLGSTHKSFFGPQGGIILGKANLKARVKDQQFPGLVDNAHWNRIAALTWALDEVRRKGPKYAPQVIANAKALAKALHEGGLSVKCANHGFTQSHQVFLDITAEEVNRFSQKLEEANMIVDHGIRLGTNESTRRGMKSRDMERIAELILRVYKGEDTSKVRRAATKLRREFKTIEYT